MDKTLIYEHLKGMRINITLPYIISSFSQACCCVIKHHECTLDVMRTESNDLTHVVVLWRPYGDHWPSHPFEAIIMFS